MNDSDFPRQPNEYDHDYENVDEEEIRDRGGSLRVAVLVVSIVIALVMIALPVLRVIDWGDDDGGNTAASEARALVAARFIDAVFVRRSTDVALRWALPRLRDEIDIIVADLNQRPAADFVGAAISFAAVACDADPGPDSECYHAWIRRPGAADLLRVQLTVTILNGDPVVTEIERINVV